MVCTYITKVGVLKCYKMTKIIKHIDIQEK